MDILEDVRHRQWDPPDEPWIFRQAWNHLLFAHWPVARDRVRELVPAFLELDTFDNEAWLSVTPFRLSDLSLRGVPAIPMISSFDEINVRTYVEYDGIPGIYFFSLDANSTLAVGAASTLFHLPYFHADIQVGQDAGTMTFSSHRRRKGPADCEVRYSPSGSLFVPKQGTLDYFLTERYCLYTMDSASHPYRVDIHHAAWELRPAEAKFAVNSMPEAAGIRLPSMDPLLHYARRQDVVTWPPRLLG
jgi:uncharacterized protein YqjF (DUF2071 family)